ncbi:uncharacterized protein LOC128731007 [Anopheles nili]|uniref:uncharacterized protein LOC128731007 n=1 Tax=Anopheles nili TaxID=185578 RepID=UPI00237AD7C1|nr:uncharacterized protein LOC128731007 [Anopheles nili]
MAKLISLRFPKKPKNGDEVHIRGKLEDNAKTFSVDFCLPRNPQDEESPSYVAYRFQTIYPEGPDSQVIQTWKNIEWRDNHMDENYWHTERTDKFSVVFRLYSESIKVFADRADHPPEYEFDLHLPLDQIEVIELRDDFENIEEISFRYAITNGD